MFLISLLVFCSVTAVPGGSAPAVSTPASVADANSGPFQQISFDDALKQAQGEHKIVLIDFFTTWCGPCKRLDATTWRDPGVIELLKEKTIALRIDAEKEAALAKRFAVSAYPTLALVKPDGTIIDTLVGYKDAKTFTASFSDSLGGKTSLAQAQAAVDSAKAWHGDAYVQARYALGQQLAQKGRNVEALNEFLWCFDDGMKNNVAYTGVRVSFLLSDLGDLAHRYPPALEAMKVRRDQARQRMEASPPDSSAAQDFSMLNHYMDDDQTTLASFEKLPAASPLRQVMGDSVFDLLLDARRYSDAISAQPFSRFRGNFSVTSLSLLLMPRDEAAEMREFESETAAKEVEALAGANQLDAARDLIKLVLAYDNSPKAHDVLLQHLTRAGHPELLPAAK